MANVYLIERTDFAQYNEYKSAVVVANSIDEAKLIHPDNRYKWDGNGFVNMSASNSDDLSDTYYSNRFLEISSNCDAYREKPTWAHPNKVKVTYIGVADDKFEAGSVIVNHMIYG